MTRGRGVGQGGGWLQEWLCGVESGGGAGLEAGGSAWNASVTMAFSGGVWGVEQGLLTGGMYSGSDEGRRYYSRVW